MVDEWVRVGDAESFHTARALARCEGLLAGGSYALIALGLALVFGTMKIINLAHGDLVLLAAYIAYVVETKLNANPMVAIPLALVIVCITAGTRKSSRYPSQR